MGNYDLLAEMPELLLPWRNPIFVQLVSHKVGRLLVPYCLLAVFVSNFFLLHGFYLAFLAAQVGWYLLACGRWLLSPAEADGSAPSNNAGAPRSLACAVQGGK